MLNCKGIVKYLLSCFSQISYLITPLDLSTENYKNSSISLSFSVLFLIVLLLQSEKLMCELWGVSFQGLLKQMYSNNKMADFFFLYLIPCQSGFLHHHWQRDSVIGNSLMPLLLLWRAAWNHLPFPYLS